MRRTVTGQVQEPEDDVTGVAAFQLAGLVVSFVVDEAGLVCGAAFCGTTNKGGVINENMVVSYCNHTLYNMLLSGFVTWDHELSRTSDRSKVHDDLSSRAHT